MTVSRLVFAGFAFVLLLIYPAVAAEPPRNEPTANEILERLDEILRRIDQLEKRIARIEQLFFPKIIGPDKHGILRDATGRPVGIWGIDGPLETEQPRR